MQVQEHAYKTKEDTKLYMQYDQIFFKNHIIRKKKYMSAIPGSAFVVPFFHYSHFLYEWGFFFEGGGIALLPVP